MDADNFCADFAIPDSHNTVDLFCNSGIMGDNDYGQI